MTIALRPTLVSALSAFVLLGAGCGGAVQAVAPVAATAQISPASVTLAPGQTQSFTASFTGAAPQSVTWAASGGTIAGAGDVGAFVAGTTPGTYTVTATAEGAVVSLATAAITIATTTTTPPTLTLAVSPASASLTVGDTQQFGASLSDGSTPSGIAWTASNNGSIGADGLFTATAAGAFTITATDGAGHSATAAVTVAAAPTPPAPPVSRLFAAAAADWLYGAPTGSGLNISAMVAGLTIAINTHDQGFDYPVQYTDGTHGCTNFTDTLQYDYTDHFCVPNPAGGYFPSVGGWGANDGHLVVVDTATDTYYDFWKLYVNSSGQLTSTNVGMIVSGNLATSNGTPGTTAASITGLAGDILPGELDCATCLNHALNVVVPGSMNSNQVGTQAPAAKTDGTVAGAIFREGAKLRFDPSIDVDTLAVSTAVKALMKALQQYGAVITDQTGGNGINFYSALATAPDLTGINQIAQHLWIYY